jgi:two-component system, chemotaxis family, protein-glutamate methylesterase/glutaminase
MQDFKHQADFHGIVAVGGSGSQGLQDMVDLVAGLPATLPAAILLSLHRPAHRPSNLASILQRASRLPVEVVVDARRLRPGVCYIGEPSQHLVLGSAGWLGVIDDPHHCYQNATIDLLFESVAKFFAGQMLGVVLAGCLADGSSGLRAINRAGGISMARTPCSQAFGDMPRNAISRAGPLHFVGAVAALSREIVRCLCDAQITAAPDIQAAPLKLALGPQVIPVEPRRFVKSSDALLATSGVSSATYSLQSNGLGT